MQYKEIPENKEMSEWGIMRYWEGVRKSVLFIVQELKEVGEESLFVDFILNPSKYMSILSEIYRENPHLKSSAKQRQKREK